MANDYERRLIRVIDHIHAHLDGDLSLDVLAEVAALSRFHFHRVYHAMIGETAAQTVRRLRLYRASVRLVQSRDPVAAVAKAAGYPSLPSFTRAFSETFAMTPLSFRKRGELRPPYPTFATGDPLMHPVEIREEPARRLAALPHKGPYNQINHAYDRLGAMMGPRGLFAQAGQMVAVYYDDPSAVAPGDLTSHAGIEMPEGAVLEPPLEEVRLPGGPHAVLRHVGPYTGLAAAYDQLYRVWLPASGRHPADSPVFEVYRNTPMDTAPEALVTEICVPLSQAEA